MANCDSADQITTSWILNKPILRILTGTIRERINRIITHLESWTADLVDQGDTSGPASIFTIFVSLVKRPLPSFSTGVGGCSFVLLFSVELFKGSRGPRGINFQVIRRWKDPFIYSNPLHTLVCVGICGGLWILTIWFILLFSFNSTLFADRIPSSILLFSLQQSHRYRYRRYPHIRHSNYRIAFSSLSTLDGPTTWRTEKYCIYTLDLLSLHQPKDQPIDRTLIQHPLASKPHPFNKASQHPLSSSSSKTTFLLTPLANIKGLPDHAHSIQLWCFHQRTQWVILVVLRSRWLPWLLGWLVWNWNGRKCSMLSILKLVWIVWTSTSHLLSLSVHLLALSWVADSSPISCRASWALASLHALPPSPA